MKSFGFPSAQLSAKSVVKQENRVPRSQAPEDQRIQRLLHILRHLGWAIPSVVRPQVIGSFRRVTLALQDGSPLLVVGSPQPLPPAEQAYRRFEDLLPVHRQLESLLLAEGLHAPLVLLLDSNTTAQLVDFTREEILIEATNNDEMETLLLPALQPSVYTDGMNLKKRWKPGRQRSGELAQWTHLWSSRLGAAAGSDFAPTRLFIQWLFLSRLVERYHLGFRPKPRFAELGIPGKTVNPSRYLDSIFRPLSEQWNLLQGTTVEAQKQISLATAQDGTLRDCLASFALLSQSKFAPGIFAEAFADEPLRILGWKNELIEDKFECPEPADLLTQPVLVDLDVEGFPPILRRYDRIAASLCEEAREQAVARERGDRPGSQMDLLGEPPPELVEEEVPSIVLQRVLKVHTSSRERADLARFVLLAHATEWHARLRRPDPIFPSVSVEGSDQPTTASPARKRPPTPFDPAFN